MATNNNEDLKAALVASYGESRGALLYEMADVESSFNPKAVSKTNAKGLMQLFPGAWTDAVNWARTNPDKTTPPNGLTLDAIEGGYDSLWSTGSVNVWVANNYLNSLDSTLTRSYNSKYHTRHGSLREAIGDDATAAVLIGYKDGPSKARDLFSYNGGLDLSPERLNSVYSGGKGDAAGHSIGYTAKILESVKPGWAYERLPSDTLQWAIDRNNTPGMKKVLSNAIETQAFNEKYPAPLPTVSLTPPAIPQPTSTATAIPNMLMKEPPPPPPPSFLSSAVADMYPPGTTMPGLVDQYADLPPDPLAPTSAALGDGTIDSMWRAEETINPVPGTVDLQGLDGSSATVTVGQDYFPPPEHVTYEPRDLLQVFNDNVAMQDAARNMELASRYSVDASGIGGTPVPNATPMSNVIGNNLFASSLTAPASIGGLDNPMGYIGKLATDMRYNPNNDVSRAYSLTTGYNAPRGGVSGGAIADLISQPEVLTPEEVAAREAKINNDLMREYARKRLSKGNRQ